MTWGGKRIEGLLLNARMVQGIYDDLNPETRHLWAYEDTGAFDAARNTGEFIAAMPSWAAQGILAFTLNLQGGSPYGYSKAQPWINSAFEADGRLRADYLARLARVLDAADGLGLVVILGCFYFGQEKVMRDEAAIVAAVDGIVDWVVARGSANVLIEINNECDIRYQQPILMPERVHELILARQGQTAGRHQLWRRRADSRSRGGRRQRFFVVARQQRRRPGDLPRHGAAVPRNRRLAADADLVQRGRSLPLQ